MKSLTSLAGSALRTPWPSIVAEFDNVFNPSYLETSEYSYLAFRHASRTGERPFHASLATISKASGAVSIEDLSQLWTSETIPAIADPKLFLLDDGPGVTFNTGGTASSVYVARLDPLPSSPTLCEFPERGTVEKNWAFFGSWRHLKVVYSLSPLRFLAADTETCGTVVFSLVEVHPTQDTERLALHRRLALGTPVLKVGDALWGVCHEKFYVGTFRAYVGRPFRLNVAEGVKPELEIGHNRLVHNKMSMLGSTRRHNRRLLSCTYFSGLTWRDDALIASYGINDVAYGFADVSEGFM